MQEMRLSVSKFLWDEACPNCGGLINHKNDKQVGFNETWRCPNCGCVVVVDDYYASKRATVAGGIDVAIVVFVPGFLMKVALLVPLGIASLYKFLKWKRA
jgi:predicted RNA-binding Zn-ribbon protein involved in translation (DUF1610 family)